MDRRDFLAGLGQAAAVVAACAQGCEGEAGEPPDIARGEDRGDGLLERLRVDDFVRGFRLDWQTYVGGHSVLTAEFREWCLSIRDLSWPDSVVPVVHRRCDDYVLTAEWNPNTDGPRIGRPVRVDRRVGLVELRDREWIRIGEA